MDLAFMNPIGSGGFGEVWLAEDLQLKRLCAVKFFTDDVRGDSSLLGQALARVAHPAVTAVYSCEMQTHPISKEAKLAVIMEYVDGERLTDLKGSVDEARAFRIVRDLMAGVEAFHDAGLVHADLHPGNVMITARGAKIIDPHYIRSLRAETSADAKRTVAEDVRDLASRIREVLERVPEVDARELGRVFAVAQTATSVAKLREVYGPLILRDPSAQPAATPALSGTIARQIQATPLSEGDLRRASEALLSAGTPPSLLKLFPDSSPEALKALEDLAAVKRSLISPTDETRVGRVSDLANLDGEARHLIVAPPGSGKTHALWHGARELLAAGHTVPIYVPAGTATTWRELELHIARAGGVDVETLLRDPRVCVLLDGWSEFAADNRAREHSTAQGALQSARIIANGRKGASLDPRFRVWDLQPLAPTDVAGALRTGLPRHPPPESQLAELLRLPLALSLYLLLGGNAVTRGELLARFHEHLSRGFPETFLQILAGAVAAVSLADHGRSRARLEAEIRERAIRLGVTDPQKLLARLGTLDMRTNVVEPIHDLYWSWLCGVGLLHEERVEASLPSLVTREGVALALESGVPARAQTIAATRDNDIILAASLSRRVGTPDEGAATIRDRVVAMMSDARLSVRCRGSLAAFRSHNEEFLANALEVISAARNEKIYLQTFGDALDLDVLFAQRGSLGNWLGAPGTDQVVDAIALRGDARWGSWLQQMAEAGKLPFRTATAAALACEERIPTWTTEHLPELAAKEAYRLRAVAARRTNVACARWIAEHYEVCVNEGSSTFVDLNSVLTACGDDAVFERLLARFPTMPPSAREQLEYAIVTRGDPWLGKFQRAAFGPLAPGSHHMLSQAVSKEIDEVTARQWIAKGHVVQGWRALIERRGNDVVAELVATLPESFDGRSTVPVLDVFPSLKDPPDGLADALWSRVRGTLSAWVAERLIYALAPIKRRGIPSLVAQFARDPSFMTGYHFARFMAALSKWQADTGFTFRVSDAGRDVDFIEWIVWRRAAMLRTDPLFRSRLISLQGILPNALLARFDSDPALCTDLIVQCGKAGQYHKGLVENLLANPELTGSIPRLFSETLDTFPEEVLLRVLDAPGTDFHTLLQAVAKAPSPLHQQVHRTIVRRVLAGEFNLWNVRAAAQMLRVHARVPLLRLLKELCKPAAEADLWLIRETEIASGELLVNERGDWLT